MSDLGILAAGQLGPFHVPRFAEPHCMQCLSFLKTLFDSGIIITSGKPRE